MSDTLPKATTELLDMEATLAAARHKALRDLALSIEELLLIADLTMGELTEVMDMFNARAQAVFSKTKLSEIKEKYERTTY